MINKIKSLLNNKKSVKRFLEANDYVTVVPFLFGAQIENRKLGRYVFAIDTDDVNSLLDQRNFVDITSDENIFKSNLLERDDLLSLIAEDILYNQEFNILIAMVHPDNWGILNSAVNIAEATSDDFDTKVKITVNSINELFSIKYPEEDE